MKSIDITVSVEDGILNVRAAAWIEKKQKILCAKFPDETISLIGGRVKLGETTAEAVCREVLEETGMDFFEQKLKAVVENFFFDEEYQKHFHEFLFVYKGNLTDPNLSFQSGSEQELIWMDKTDIYQLRPAVLGDLVSCHHSEEIIHLINKE